MLLVLSCGIAAISEAQSPVHRFSWQGDVRFIMTDNKIGLEHTDHQTLIAPIFDEAMPFDFGYSVVRIGEKYGVIDQLGRDVLPCQYEDIAIISNKTFILKSDSQYQIMNPLSKSFVEPLYDSIQVKDDCAIVEESGRYGMVDLAGSSIIPCRWQRLGFFHDGWAFVQREDGKYNYIDRNENLLLPEWVEGAFDFSGGYGVIVRGEDVLLISSRGESYGHRSYEIISPFPREGIFTAKYDGCWDIINTQNHTTSDFLFDDIVDMQNGLLAVMLHGKWGFADANGKIVINCQYKEVRSFFENRAFVQEMDESWSIIDTTGKKISPIDAETIADVQSFTQGLAAIKVKNLQQPWRIIDLNGKTVFSLNIPDMPYINDSGYIYVYDNKSRKSLYYDYYGNLMISYDD